MASRQSDVLIILCSRTKKSGTYGKLLMYFSCMGFRTGCRRGLRY